MRWFVIPKSTAVAPINGSYRNWKPELAEEGQHQCAYCALPEGRFGGIHNFHVDHFQPRKIEPTRENDWTNLFYSCAICNIFKRDDWPDPAGPFAFPNPGVIDYETVFVKHADGRISGATSNARYFVERLNLNRNQLVLERREAALRRSAQRVRADVTARIASAGRGANATLNVLRQIFLLWLEIDQSLDALAAVRPYETTDTKRVRE